MILMLMVMVTQVMMMMLLVTMTVMMIKMTVMMPTMMQTFGRSPRPNKQSIIQVLPKIFTVTEKAVCTNTNTIQRRSCINKHKYKTFPIYVLSQ